MKFVIKDEVDMLLKGHHRLLLSEHHAYAKAGRRRIIKGKEDIEKRETMAKILGNHVKVNTKEMGRIEE